MSIVIFDLFGTLIQKEQYDYNKALQWLADTCFDHKFLELQKLSAIFKENYMKNRMISDSETSFLEQLKFFENQLNIQICGDYYAIESHFIHLFRDEKLIDGASELLQFLYDRQYLIYIFSNSLFSGNSLKTYLGSLGIDHYVEKVYSSADIGFRKPSISAFRYIMADIGIEYPKEVYYIGDSYEKDYIGAQKSGMNSILVTHNPDYSDMAFENLHLLLNYMKDLLNSSHDK